MNVILHPVLTRAWISTHAVQLCLHKRAVVSRRVHQSKGPGFKSRFEQIAYFHGVKTRFSTLGTGDVPRGSDSM